MRAKMIYDLPTRIFHWTFAALFLFSFVAAKNADDESVVYMFHMLAGFVLGFLVMWRIFWGIFGSEHARFADFRVHPKDLFRYFLGIVTGKKRKWSGHNPASSWSTIIMLVLALGLAVSGYLMGSGYKEELEDLHELMANTFLVVVVMHIAGIVVHSWQHRDSVGLSMLDGKKDLEDNIVSIPDQKKAAAAILVVLILAFGTYLILNFNADSGTLLLFGRSLTLAD
ncbi:cytochrome b [Bdellovibrio sp. ZAP7]|uniref:cytochrome b/b6 domain-containing protein n=1 Tax=Bdellovibrio sp. ZAP7 TaxID=2231053 RepID=UPI00115AFC05|nr:cytochrome b/b6 domain-containing protein [Bdellovibrio sp. ZAP7]QDK47076.1 cytochrome b [Bdellovibrio sp. ZAP7]